ncbi:MAG: hypothetical protein M1824_005381 [Vezdaea acicularis]|nr:MAG: hypothetical protein M1824_005381 [Vezdaea acicularis]
MPIRWTAENDHLLLLKLLETHPSLSVDAKAIVASWPTHNGDVPTARAVTERFVKIRKDAKAKGIVGDNGKLFSVTKPKGGTGVVKRRSTTTPSPTKARGAAARKKKNTPTPPTASEEDDDSQPATGVQAIEGVKQNHHSADDVDSADEDNAIIKYEAIGDDEDDKHGQLGVGGSDAYGVEDEE